MDKKVFTRDDYMNKICTHHEYYSQFAHVFKRWVELNYHKTYLTEKFEKDEHLNNLGIGWMKRFDLVTECCKLELSQLNLKINGLNSWSHSMGTCAIKAAMRQIIDEKD